MNDSKSTCGFGSSQISRKGLDMEVYHLRLVEQNDLGHGGEIWCKYRKEEGMREGSSRKEDSIIVVHSTTFCIHIDQRKG